MPINTRDCPFRDCRRKVRPDRFCCPAHWHQLSADQQRRIYRCYGQRLKREISGEELRRLQRQVLDEVGA